MRMPFGNQAQIGTTSSRVLSRNYAYTVGLLTLWSFVLVVPHLLTIGENIVGRTYSEGSLRFWQGLSPFAPPVSGDVFLYSPFFAFFYRAFLLFPEKLRVLLWALLNSAVFWGGICLWFRLERRSPWYVWLAWIACSMEIDGPLRYQQINPLLVGLILMGCYYFREGRKSLSGIFLGLATNLKLIPIPFLALVFPKHRRFGVAVILTLMVLFVVPAIGVGWNFNWQFHLEQMHRLIAEASLRKILDIASVGERFGYPTLGITLRYLVMGVGFGLMVISRFIYDEKSFPWGAWISVGLATILLVNPRTESPTFVLIAPAYLFLMVDSRKVERGFLIAAFWLVTFSYNTLWPVFLRTAYHTNFTTKTMGVLLIWILCVVGFARPAHLRLNTVN